MPAYQVLLSKAARKQLNTLPVFIQNKIIEDITSLSETPRKLKGQKNAWRIRIADYRVIYEIKDNQLLILVVAVGHRKTFTND